MDKRRSSPQLRRVDKSKELQRRRARSSRVQVTAKTYPRTIRSTRNGILGLSALSILFALVLVLSLFRIQVSSHQKYSQDAAAVHYERSVIAPQRGKIVDRNGLPLAVSTYEYTIGMTPSAIHSWKSGGDRDVQIMKRMGEILSIENDVMLKLLKMKDEAYVTIKKGVDRETTEKLKAYLKEMVVGGVVIDTVAKRSYPEKELASSVVGFVSTNESLSKGVIGLESYYDVDLRGTPGYRFRPIDNYSGHQLPFSESTEQEAVNGYTLQLHLDSQLQAYSEDLLRQWVKAFNIKDGAEIIVMNPKTGAVLAMANSETFDLNDPYGPPSYENPKNWKPFENQKQMDYIFSKRWANQSVSRNYEPGSTYKAITVAAALEEKSVKEDQYFSDAPIWVPGFDTYPISCWSGDHHHGYENIRQGLANSCNPIMVQTAYTLGIKRFYDYVRAFGHRDLTGIDLPAESISQIHLEKDAKLFDMAPMSFGESNTLTPIQLLNAFNVFGNGGYLPVPRVVSKILDDEGSVVREIKPEYIRQVLSKETTDKMLDYLRAPVEESYNKLWLMPGYGLAGKSSTSNYELEGDPPGTTHGVLSFASVSPYWDPQVSVLVIMHDVPKTMTSATLLKMNARIAERALELNGVQRHYSDQDVDWVNEIYYVPDLKGKKLSEVPALVMDGNLDVVTEAKAKDTDVVKFQSPPAGAPMNRNGQIYVTYAQTSVADEVDVPNFVGMTHDQARILAKRLRLNLFFQGSPTEKITEQSVTAGQRVKAFTVVRIFS